MDLQTCIKKMQLVGVLTFATVDEHGHPQQRNISAIHYGDDGIYFYTARGKNFCHELLTDGHVQTLAYTRFKEMIRLSGIAKPVPEDEQEHWKDVIFEEQPYLVNVYPGQTREIGIVFRIADAKVEYFNLGTRPIERYYYALGKATPERKGFEITDTCIACGTCVEHCPQGCIDEGVHYHIQQDHCLHCGNCYEHCPTDAIIRL